MEISAAVQASKSGIHRVVAMARRLQAECPDAYDAWKAGNICQERAMRINRALRRLVFASSKQLLNSMVVDIAIGQTPELLGRWLNQFVARVEPDEQDERLHRAMEDRYVSIRPDLDGMSFLSALMSSVDAAAVHRILTALAAAAEPGDLRTMAQRRSDAMVDMLCGRISNGCHVVWDSNTDADDHLDDVPGASKAARSGSINDHVDPSLDGETADEFDNSASPVGSTAVDVGSADERDRKSADDKPGTHREPTKRENRGWDDASSEDTSSADPSSEDGSVVSSSEDASWEDTDWVQPASVFRPDPRARIHDEHDEHPSEEAAPHKPPLPPEMAGRTGNGSWRVTPGTGEHKVNPLPVSIGVVVSIQSLFGFSNTPGQLMDRSALVAADQIRELAQQQGTLFYRLLTDDKGRLLDVTEMVRFPSRKLAMAIKFRDGMCTGPTCHNAATECDIDHLTPHPAAPTTAINLNDDCRPEHRAKTFAGHVTARNGPHRTSWTTPTGHTYFKEDPTLPVEEWEDSTSQLTGSQAIDVQQTEEQGANDAR